jgi:hypothetical protein
MSNEPAEAVFHAGMLPQLYDETKNVDEVTQVATALLAARPADHVRRVAWFLPTELLQVLPKQKHGRIVPLQLGTLSRSGRPQDKSSGGSARGVYTRLSPVISVRSGGHDWAGRTPCHEASMASKRLGPSARERWVAAGGTGLTVGPPGGQ